MTVEMSNRQFRRLLDMVYIGNWVLNSMRGAARISDYDKVESLLFEKCLKLGWSSFATSEDGEVVPSAEFSDGGIHDAIRDYEDAVFFDILAEELAWRDIEREAGDPEDEETLNEKISEYIAEFEENGTDNITVMTT